jgi:hypothetical protein
VRFTRVSLRNFKCYEDADVHLDPGVTVIHGLNGSGKSSLLEACFFALYGATALDKTLEEIVTIGADEAEIDLWFTHAGDDYHVYRRVRNTGERASTPDCTLETPSGTIDGVTDVEDHVTGLLRMDAEAFVNCAYVRQGEVNKLINASASTRQAMLDDLLQLGKLEDYRQRAGDARLGVEDVKSNVEGRLDGLDEQIAAKEAEDPHETLAALESLGDVVFHRVRIRPGKPIAVARLPDHDALAVAIPGKPIGAYVSAALVARPLFTGDRPTPTLERTITHDIGLGPEGFEYAIPVTLEGDDATPLGHVDSPLAVYEETFDPSVLSSSTRAATADGFVLTTEPLDAGARVHVIPTDSLE